MTPQPRLARTRAVVLAAGLGTRMKSRLPKVLHPICGRPLIDYVLDAAEAASGSRPLVIWSPPVEAVRDAVASRAETALQAEPRGTGDALAAGLTGLATLAGDAPAELLVLSGDVPLVEADLLDALLAEHRAATAAVSLISVITADPGRLGRVVRDEDGEVERIIEAKDATEDELEIEEINSGLYAFDAGWVRARIGDLRPSAVTGEIYITDLVALARADGRAIGSIQVADDGTLDGINDRAQLAEATFAMQARINERHLLAGVTMLDPTTAHVDASVHLDADVTLEPNVSLRGSTRVAAGTTIGTGSLVVDTLIGRDCRILASVLESSEVEDSVQIGPFAHLRPGSSIGTGVKLGNFAEVKNSRLDAGVQQHHMSYIGDAQVGARTNIGAGTITANYDGKRKKRTTIGADAFIGVDTMLVAPVELGAGARTGAGAVVNRDVPAGKLAVGVPARLRDPRPEPEEPSPG
ncbi:MAG TPA: bifunctional UDP-N-acetylglucosamine diphosphorylase/glucosamine-1-phosphate N-acetyltransferase GlmU [Candidatus Limnocylindrales bacterium]|jgi:bifunctional UDP-N-acetylglucosamine pyrophosphorylase/glucosamine-1-phosphate N-acetyltransferase